ncbi:MAG: hypothetical protein JNN12_06305 [Bacteroidetes Order II. Incertae sedis bacterium]|nr:hypothetical protein [Bacteroidetes Order II. bacterium]
MVRLGQIHSLWLIWLFALQPNSLVAQAAPYIFEHLTIEQGLSHNTVYSVLQDRFGMMWFATHNGLNKYDGYGFKVFNTSSKTDPAFEGRIITTLLEDRNGHIWVGTQNRGVNILDLHSGRFTASRKHPQLSALSDTWITRLFEDKKGWVWITTIGKGIFAYDPDKKELHAFNRANKKLTTDHAFDLTQDEQGHIWVVTDKSYLSRFHAGTKRFTAVTLGSPHTIELLGYRKVIRAQKDGTLWIGTDRQGLFKFRPATGALDRFPLEAAGISYNEVRDIDFAKDGTILVATDGGGLYYLRAGSTRFMNQTKNVTRPGNLNTNALYDIFVAKDQNIWIGSYNGGINVHKARKVRFDHFAHTGFVQGELSHSSVLCLLETRKGEIWIGTDGGGLNRFNPITRTFSAFTHQPTNPSSLSGNVVKSLYEAPDGKIWIGYFGRGLDVLDPITGKVTHFQTSPDVPASIHDGNVWSISGSPDGHIFIAILGDGLIVYEPKSKSFTHYKAGASNAQNLPTNDLMYVRTDTKNRVWIGTRDQGLVLFMPNSGEFKSFKSDHSKPSGLNGSEVRTVFEDRKGRIWVGTEDGGLNLWKGGNQFWKGDSPRGLLSESVMGIREDPKGYLWISTLSGLARLSPQSGTIENFNFHHHTQANQFNQAAILLSRSGQLMVGGINGLMMLNPEEVTKSELHPQVRITELRVFNDSILPGKGPNGRVIYQGRLESTPTIFLSYLDNAFSLDFATSDLSEPQNNRFEYMLIGFHKEWQQLEIPRHSVNFTNLEPGNYTFRIKGTNSMGKWSPHETSLIIHISPPFWKSTLFRIFVFLLFVWAFWQSYRLLLNRRERHLRQQMIESERALLQLKNEKLASDLAAKSNQLVSMSLQMAHKNDFLNKVKKELKETPPDAQEASPSLHGHVIKLIDAEVRGEDFWERFNAFFEETNSAFAQELRRKHPDLSANDLRICSLMLINVNTKEMASILNISPKGVEKSRYRLKKKLGLTPEEDLTLYLKSFANTLNSTS